MASDIKMECVREIEAVIGRELDGREQTALYAESDLTTMMQARGITLGDLKFRLGIEAGNLESVAESAKRRAKALRRISRAHYAHRGLPSDECAALAAASLCGEAPCCPVCGAQLDPTQGSPKPCMECPGECSGPVVLACPKCGAHPICKGRPESGAGCVVVAGLDELPMSALANKAAQYEAGSRHVEKESTGIKLVSGSEMPPGDITIKMLFDNLMHEKPDVICYVQCDESECLQEEEKNASDLRVGSVGPRA